MIYPFRFLKLTLTKLPQAKFFIIALMFQPSIVATPAQRTLPPTEPQFTPPHNTSGIHGILEVDPSSGAASLLFPLGPGIGRPGLEYIPGLVGLFAPHAGVTPSGFELSPGSLSWPQPPNTPDKTLPAVRWTYPDGTGGRIHGPYEGALTPSKVLARFGYTSPTGQNHAPQEDSAPPPLAFSGTGGEYLLALMANSIVPAQSSPCRYENTQDPGQCPLPLCLLVIRGDLAYEFHNASRPRLDEGSGEGHYRLTAVRAPSGESITFTYGPNGLDFEAAWMDTKIRVALTSQEKVSPVPALDTGIDDWASLPPSKAFKDIEARLRVTYEGFPAVAMAPNYTVDLLLNIEDLQPGDFPTNISQDAPSDPAPIPYAFQSRLQIIRIQADTDDGSVEFTYGKAPIMSLAKPDGTQHFAPTVLQEIALSHRCLQLTWDGQCQKSPLAPFIGPPPSPSGAFGVKAIFEKGVPTYQRTRDSELPTPEPPESVSGPSWSRQSRHFTFAPSPKTGGSCKTFIRDRWILKQTAQPSSHERHQIQTSSSGDIPTFTWDPINRILVPVAGLMTRRLDWEPEGDMAPNLHFAVFSGGTETCGGLMGGAPGFGTPGMNPALEQLNEMAARSRAEGRQRMAEQEAKMNAILARQDAQIQAQVLQGIAKNQAFAQASFNAAIAREKTAKAKKLETEIMQKQEDLDRQANELNQRRQELEQQAEALKRQAEELERQAEALI